MRIRTLSVSNTDSERELKIQFGRGSEHGGNFFSILVGENGTRKSQSLRAIVDLGYSSITRVRQSGLSVVGRLGQLTYWSNRNSEQKVLPSKIIAVSGGVLICGAPCSGKTTVLRDLARLLSTKGKKNVALIDERGELAGTASGKFQNDIGMCDVYDSYNKSEAMLHAIRSMAPEIVICDEIGSKEDIYAVEKSVNCGVRIISSTHCANEYELKQKANMVSLMKTGAFQTLVFLSNRTHAGEIVKISQVGDNFAV